MGFKYAIRSDKPHFLTHTIVDWIDVFTRRELADVIVNSLNYCIMNKGLEVYVWCLMSSHLHMIAGTAEKSENDLSGIMRDFKKFTSKTIIETIGEINESRREWILNHFKTGWDKYHVWQEGMRPIELFTRRFTNQKMDYIHNNPVVAGIVREPQDYLLSSSADYYCNRKGLVKICYIE
ncbi:transposase [soil metagenome]